MANTYLRPYELSLWTLQDEFVTVLKWSEVEHKGQAQSPSMKLVDDGTSEFDFSIPRQFYEGDTKIFNPLWQRVQNGLIIANMHKIKVIFNKKEADEAVFEFLITSVTENHEKDEVMYDIHCEGLAFHELGKIGYKTALSSDDFLAEYKAWFDDALGDEMPGQSLSYWNDKVFKYTDLDGIIKWRYNWEYEVQMDWSSFSFSGNRATTKVYEEEYVESWNFTNNLFTPKSVQGAREKWRAIDVEESNVYNITQTIAETFGVFCKYKYEYDDNYHITKRKVIYYNNYLAEADGHIDITYPYTSSAVTRTTDNTDVITKLFVRPIESEQSDSNLITIMDVDANKTREDYLLNFDYLYSIGNLTQEQYDYIPEYEKIMRKYNDEIVVYASKVQFMQNQLVDEEAKVAFHSSALKLDKEQIDTVDALRANLTAGNAGITIDSTKPEMLLLRKDTNNALSGRYVEISLEGVIPSTVKLYATIDYAATDSNRLTNEVTGGVFEYNEFGNLYRISNLSIKSDLGEINRLYMTCTYIPLIYYDNIVNTWTNRLHNDEKSLAAAQKQVKAYYLQLYGADADYARVGYAITNYAAERLPEIGAVKYAATPRLHALMYSYEGLIDEKQIEIIKFEKLMGSALREGYWQPDNYTDYGNKFTGAVTVPFKANQASIIGASDETKFIWDTEAFDNELTYHYTVGVEEDTDYHLAIDLSSLKDLVSNHLTDLSFIYYDERIQTLNNNATTNQVKLANLDVCRRSLTIGGGCQFAYILSSGTYKPILLLTGDTALSTSQKKFIMDAKVTSSKYTNYSAYLGVITTTIDDNQVVNIKPNRLTSKKLKFLTSDDITNKQLVYPRIQIPSLKLKIDPTELLLTNNGASLTMYTDFTPLARSLGTLDSIDSYFITLKPEVLLSNGSNSTTIRISYALSNADVAIYLDAQEVLKENSKPQVSYDVKLSVINKEFIRTAYNKLNHIVNINDYELQLEDTHGYISSLTLNLDQPSDDTVEIKNYTSKFEDLFSKIVAQSEAMKKNQNTINFISQAISPNGGLSSSLLQDSILKADLNYAFNQGKLTIDEKNGIWGVSDAGVVAMRGGGIFTATEKNEDGEWIWNTGILPSGINADLITSGQLDTNRIKIYAGDKIKFQLNGEGLFAYKSLLQDKAQLTTAAATAIINNLEADGQTKDLDYKQYVTFNDNGLFLIADDGAYILNDAGNAYEKLTKQVKRVEISWNGLILRNWNDDDVFWADPKTGNLNLKGTITAKSGQIGGWDILEDRLNGNYMSFVNSDNISDNGIFLSNTASSQESFELNGTTYYIYKRGNNIYYSPTLPSSGNTTITVNNSTVKAYIWATDLISVVPNFLVKEEIAVDAAATSANSYNPTSSEDDSTSGSATSQTTTSTTRYVYYKYYIGKSTTQVITDSNGNKIEYNGSTSPNASWYTKISSRSDIDTIVTRTFTTSTTKLIDAGLATNTTLTLYTYKPTFSVLAATGYITMQKGTLGNFTFSSSSLTGGTLDKTTIQNCSLTTSNSVKVGSKTYGLDLYGQCFKDFTANSSAGTFTLTRINGGSINFNIGDTAYFRNALLEVSTIDSHTSTSNYAGRNSYITCVAKTKKAYGIEPYTSTLIVDAGQFYLNGYRDGKKAGQDSVNFAGTYWDDSGTYHSSDRSITITVRIKLTNGVEKTLAGWRVLGVSDAYNDGYTDGYGTASNKVSHYTSITVDPGETYYIQVPTGNNGGTRNITVKGSSQTTCFAEGTQVTLYNGTTCAIEQLRVGQQIQSYDEETNIFKQSEIISVKQFKNANNIYDIYLSSGKIMTLTASHPLLVQDKGWCAIDIEAAKKEHDINQFQSLEENDILISSKENIISIQKIIRRKDLDGATVYNIDVEPYDTYVVEDVVVHNANDKN